MLRRTCAPPKAASEVQPLDVWLRRTAKFHAIHEEEVAAAKQPISGQDNAPADTSEIGEAPEQYKSRYVYKPFRSHSGLLG